MVWFLSTTLLDLGFKINPYKQCIVNKVFDEYQCNIRLFVSDNKVSHMKDIVTSMIDDNIEETFGKLSRKTVNKHMFLCMDIEFIGGEKVTVSTTNHVGKALEDFFETLKGNAAIPANSQLFAINSKAKDLNDKKRSMITR